MNENFKRGIALGKAHFSEIEKKGKKWKTRNIPGPIRDKFLMPYYITELDDVQSLFIIQMPISKADKVSFLLFSQSSENASSPDISIITSPESS